MDPRISTPGYPYKQTFGMVKHYYGDVVRVIFVAIAILLAVSIPFSGDIQTGVTFGVPAVLLLVGLAGFTSPHSKVVLIFDAIASGLGFFFLELSAMSAYSVSALPAFAFIEFICALFLIAFYFSVKTVRAMTLGQIGQRDQLGEFDDRPRS